MGCLVMGNLRLVNGKCVDVLEMTETTWMYWGAVFYRHNKVSSVVQVTRAWVAAE